MILDVEMRIDSRVARDPEDRDADGEGPSSSAGSRTPKKVIRDPEFAKRLAIAFDHHPVVPPPNYGRNVWIKEQLEKRFAASVSVEAVRKWASGEMRPRPQMLSYMARLLEVDESWLSLGIEPELAPREQRARNAMADGAVNVVAGLIQINGGSPAFPEENDERAKRAHIDLYAIIKGAQYALHISLAQSVDDGDGYRFTVPINFKDAFQMGVIVTGVSSVLLVEIDEENIAAGHRKGPGIEVHLKAADVERLQIRDLKKRL
jgi:transcriptional regulator with XRE-family HTH domain